ncbi:MAG: RagB/SusD family nutrient uptake outer membrane protein [Candidatus Symbiothrix sp.]|jgi:hypothetical protein|nr:RagB/SusD family nutrient uptake outer membrane protein [Candidatus Symbiothrix sp.]
MKQIKQNIVRLLLCSTVLLSVSCSDGFFDLEPNDKIPTDVMYKTAEDFNLAVIGCYSRLQTQVNFYLECCEYRSDNLYLAAPTTGTQDRYDIDRFQDKASNGILQDSWMNFDNTVHRCNMILDRIDEASIDETLKKQYKGEAMFIRAFNYFNMYRVWGGVPTTRKTVTVAEAFQIGRSSDEQMYELIAGDLQQIVDENMLPTSYSGDNVGRITSGAALSLLGKVYLTFHQWEKARVALAQVIGKYTLQANPADVFDVNKKMNSEIIFAVRFNKTVPGEGHGFWNSVPNLNEETNQTASLIACYSDPNDKRKALITYVKAPGESSVCVPQKFLDTRDATTKNVGNDQIILRYADVLLMYAEALNEIAYTNSQTSPAMQSLNEVHTRAGLTTINIATLPDKESFRRAIMVERQQEFPYEGHRWFDLIRMGYAKEAMATNGHLLDDFQFLFPIPKTEIERINNETLLWQNLGYK